MRSILAVFLVVGVLLAALFSFEQATLRPLAEYTVERLTGRALRIEGELEATAGSVVGLRIGSISLANADWGSEEAMLRLAGVEISIDLTELLSGRHPIDRIVVSDGRLLVEKNADGRSNWALGSGAQRSAEGADSKPSVLLPVRRSRLSDIAIRIVDPGLSRPLEVRLDRVTHEIEHDESLRLNLDGEIGGRPLAVETRVTRLTANLIEFDLEAASGATRLVADGRLDDPFRPQSLDLQMTLTMAEISETAGALGLPAVIVGATRLDARLVPEDDHHGLEFNGRVGELEFDGRARLESLDTIDGLAVELKAAAPDLAAVIRLPGEAVLPPRPFEMNSRLSLSGNRLEIGETHVDYGDIRLLATGLMSRFPSPEGSKLDLLFEGDNYLDVAGMLGFRAAPGMKPAPFELHADFDYGSQTQQTFEAGLKLADLDGKFSGTLAGYPSFAGSSIDYRLAGQDARLLQQWLSNPARIDGAYSLQGRVTRTDRGYEIGETKISLGENRLDISGRIGNRPLRGDSGLKLRYQGPDLDRIAALAGLEGFLPRGPASIDAAAHTRDDGIQVDQLEIRLDRSEMKASGFLSPQPGFAGSRADLEMKTEDIAELLPGELQAYVNQGQALELKGRLSAAGERLTISELRGKLGETGLRASGRVSLTRPLRDTSLDVRAEGPDLAAVVPAELIPYAVPKQPFSLDGGIGFDETGLVIDAVDAVIGTEKLRLSGSIPFDDPREGLHLVFTASGSNLGLLVPAGIDTYGFDGLPYQAAADVALAKGVVSLRRLSFTNQRGNLSGELDISIDDPPGFGRFDLQAKGENLQAFLPPLPRYRPAAEAFDFDARGGWSSERIEVGHGAFSIGDSHIEVHGELGIKVNQGVSRFVVSARGDNLADLGTIDESVLPREAFEVEALLEGDADHLLIPAVKAKVGESDLLGRLLVEYGDVPKIEIAVKSRLIDLSAIYDLEEKSQAATEEAGPPIADGRLIPDIPVPVDYLKRVNGVVEIDLDELRFPRNVFHDIGIDASLQDGDLQVSRLRARGVEGELLARFRATADQERLVTRGELQGIDIVLGAGEAREQGEIYPKQNYHLEFDTSGATSRELAANLNGYIQLTGGEGRLYNNVLLDLFGSFFAELLSAVNPFVTRQPYTTIACFAAYAEIVDGVATINPGAVLQTGKIDIFARGQVDLRSEKISLRFDTTARQGLGISLGDFVNPFVGVGGTLASPRLGVDPKNAMFEGGFAVATGGTTVILKNLYRRWLGSGSPCADFAAEAEKYLAEREQKKQSGAPSSE